MFYWTLDKATLGMIPLQPMTTAKLRRPALTKRQHEILSGVKRYIKANGYAPSNSDLCQLFGLWPSGVEQHLKLIEKKGYLKRTPNIARGLVVL